MKRCDICEGTSFSNLYAVGNANIIPRISQYDILRCDRCGFCIMDPYPTKEEVCSIYSKENIFSNSFLGESGVRTNTNPNDNKFMASFLEPLYKKYVGSYEFIVKYIKKLCKINNPKIIEIGCGSGELLHIIKKNIPNAKIVGVEIDSKAKERSNCEIKNSIIVGDILTTDLDNDYDVVIMNFLIEHLHDHDDFMKKVHSILKSDGLLIVSTPDIESMKAKELKEKWSSINCPHIKTGHIKWFSKESIRLLGEKYGFSMELFTRKGEIFYYFPKIVQKILTALLQKERLGVYERFIRNYQIRMAWCIVMDGLLGARLGLGENLYVFMRKK